MTSTVPAPMTSAELENTFAEWLVANPDMHLALTGKPAVRRAKGLSIDEMLVTFAREAKLTHADWGMLMHDVGGGYGERECLWWYVAQIKAIPPAPAADSKVPKVPKKNLVETFTELKAAELAAERLSKASTNSTNTGDAGATPAKPKRAARKKQPAVSITTE